MTGAAKTLVYFALALPLFAQAQIVMCKDEKGRTYTSDRPIPECQGRAQRHYGKSATVVREIPAPPTAEERRRMQEEEEKKRALAKIRREQMRQDQVLLSTYRSEDEISMARERTAKPLYEMIKYEKTALAQAEGRRDQALARLAQAQQSKDPGADEWKRRVEAAEGTVKASAAKLQAYEAELVQVRNDYDAKIKRYREIKGSEATVASQP